MGAEEWGRRLAGLRRAGLPRREVAERVARARRALERGGLLNERHVASMTAALVGCGEVLAAEALLLGGEGGAAAGAVGSYAFSIVQGEHVRQGRFERALRLLGDMRSYGVSPDRVNYNVLLGARLPASTVRRLLREMEQEGVAPDERTYTGAINALARRRGGFNAAQELWNDMRARGVEPSAFTWCALVSAAAEEGEAARASALVEEMRAAGVRPTVAVQNAALKAFARRRDASGAVAALERLRSGGSTCDFAPNAATFNVVMEACCRSGSSEALGRVDALFRDLLAEGLEPTERTFGVVLRAAGHKRDLDWLERVLADMQARGVRFNQPLYDHTVHAYVRCGQGSLALGVLEKMVEAGFSPALGVSEVLIRSGEAALLRKCLAANNEGALAALLRDMQRSGIQLTSATCARVCREVLRREGVGATLAVAETMQSVDSLGMIHHRAGRELLVRILSRAADEEPAAAATTAKWLLPALERASQEAKEEYSSAGTPAPVPEARGRGRAPREGPERWDGEPPALSEAVLNAAAEAGNFALAHEVLRLRAADCPLGTGGRGASPDEVLLETADSALRRALSDLVHGEAGLTDFRTSGIKPKPQELDAALQKVLQDEGGTRDCQTDVTAAPRQAALLPQPSRKAALQRPRGRTAAMRRLSPGSAGGATASHSRKAALRRALQLVEHGSEYFDWEVGAWAYQQIMDALVRAGDFEGAAALWEKCRRDEPETVDVKSWTVNIRALAGMGQLSGRAAALLAEVEGGGVQPDRTMLKTLLDLLNGCRDEEGVRLVQARLEALAQSPRKGARGRRQGRQGEARQR